MSKVLLLDVDGVVIRPRNKYFSETYSQDYGVPIEEIVPFFKGGYKRAAIGEVDIKDVLLSYLIKWGWKGNVDEFLRYWFESERDTDEKVMEFVSELRHRGVKVHLVSDNEANRAKYLMEDVGLKNIFDGAFFSSALGVTKSDPEFYKKVVEKLKVKPEEVEYWDDDPKNVEVAKGVGINAQVYGSFEEFKERVVKI
ncbi:MAG TPA: HAD-IA family hydrolase [Patescibacteria group bacterium]|nr:HAD-IA family hydrolase [Patescibacteria group bacterium]